MVDCVGWLFRLKEAHQEKENVTEEKKSLEMKMEDEISNAKVTKKSQPFVQSLKAYGELVTLF